MSQHQVLESTRLQLRPLETSDEDSIVEFMSERKVTEFLLHFGYPICREQVRSWLNNVLSATPEQCGYWALVDKESGRLIGVICLTLDSYNRKGEIGYWMAKNYWGRGLMTEATWRVAQYCFDTLKLHRLELTHMVANKASQRVSEKVGFQLEGCWREGHWKDGQFKDVKIYGMLAVDYERARKRFAAVDPVE
ncbi:MAG: GNAT family N-acetyltransferase [Puniceicoccales bacterium]|jgi:RimJ/RimL family protein N-acetyltransferase|nr:GNAT family N-acetyltransferase [Puniceicoccales bacterium]